MRKKPTINDYYVASAYVKLLKMLICKASIEIGNRIDLNCKDRDKWNDFDWGKRVVPNDLFDMEDYLQKDYPELDNRNFCDMFYGGFDRMSETDKKGGEQAIIILENMLNMVKNQVND